MKNLFQKQGLNFALLGLATLPTALQAKDTKEQKPNVLFIAVDDLKPVLGCYGTPIIKTPNIDRLANQGTVFLNNYVQQAISGATRASCLTGMRPDYTQVWDLVTRMRDMNPDIITIPQYFISQGYTTAGVGKIFHPSCVENLDQPSWSIPYLTTEDYYPSDLGQPVQKAYQSQKTKDLVKKYRKEAEDKGLTKKEITSYITKHIKPSIECVDVPDNAYEDGTIALAAKDQLKKFAKSGQPFFFAVGFHKPHLPFVSPKKYWDLYNRKDMPVAEFQEHAKNSPDIAYHRSGELKQYTDIPELCTFTDQQSKTGLNIDKQRELIHGYYAAVSYTDAQVGILLNTLESLGMLNNTIIVLWGDHGWHLGDHDLWCKHTNFENATHAPLIISGPGIKPGKTKSMTEFVDIFPTLCDLAGIPIPTQLDGTSLVPVMKDVNKQVKEYAVSQYPRNLKNGDIKKLGLESGDVMGYSLRTLRYRYTVWMDNSFRSNSAFDEAKVYATELYDYEKDPLEKVNVVNSREYASVSKDMKSKLLIFFKSQEKIGPYINGVHHKSSKKKLKLKIEDNAEE